MANAPQALGKKQREQREEQSGHFMPQCAAGSGKWLPEGAAETAAAPGSIPDEVAAGNYVARGLGTRLRGSGGLCRLRPLPWSRR